MSFFLRPLFGHIIELIMQIHDIFIMGLFSLTLLLFKLFDQLAQFFFIFGGFVVLILKCSEFEVELNMIHFVCLPRFEQIF
jgi:hypothetical protein